MKKIAEMSIGELAAFVCSHLQSHGVEVVLTGGGCVEIYSSGKYSSFDLDFIENVPVGGRKLGKILEEIQFFRKDRLAAYYHWKDRECLEQALLVSNSSEVDFTEIERWSRNEGCEADFARFHNLYQIRIEQQ